MIDFNNPIAPVPAPDRAAGDGGPAGTGPAATGWPRNLAGPPLVAVLGSLNHLLTQQAWAREKLRMFAGRTVAVGFEPASPLARLAPPLRAQVTDAGLLGQASGEAPADVCLWLKPSPSVLFDGLSGGPQGLQRHLRVEGDVMMAATLAELAQHLRWDAEEDLSRVVGDIAARRVFRLFDGLRRQFGRDQARVRQSAVEYFTAESGQLTERAALDSLAGQVAQLNGLAEQLARRVGALSAAPRAPAAAQAPRPAGR